MIVRNRKQGVVKKMGLAAVGALALSAGLAAHGADEYAISYSEKELTNSAGVEQVHERIVKAAKQYCPTYSQIRSHAEVKLCVDGVVEDLVQKVNHPQLSSLHESGSAVSIAGEFDRKTNRS